jgi:hypothetical protein
MAFAVGGLDEHQALELPVDIQGTAFQASVWKVLGTIPFGETLSYSEVAEKLGRKDAVRAVATAAGKLECDDQASIMAAWLPADYGIRPLLLHCIQPCNFYEHLLVYIVVDLKSRFKGNSNGYEIVTLYISEHFTCTFQTRLLRPTNPGEDSSWAFLVLPKAESNKLTRRGRTSVEGTINDYPFQATLEPDGQLSHWLKVSKELREAAGAEIGKFVTVQISQAEPEPEPALPDDLKNALAVSPEAKAVWDATTTIARLDWIHWIESAKQAKTRERRVDNACDMLASGKKRVCCFDQSGYYSKSLSAPKVAS